MNTTRVHQLLTFVADTLPTAHPTLGYQPEEIEAALLEAAFSARALYGSPTTGVRAVLERWRGHRGTAHIDNLDHLAMFAEDPEHLVAVLGNRQRVPGNHCTKAEAVALAARSLSVDGCSRASDLTDADPDRIDAFRATFVAVPGFGRRTWENVTIRLGLVTDDASTAIDEFLGQIPGFDDRGESPEALVAEAARHLRITPQLLTYGMWKFQRESQRKRARAARVA
ncbi:MAG: hypothetical protein GX610_22475 [Rhodococcus sp.]|nr:hypothetical protein [Rhodococcus sp. (in: high G+C Gram-positive bacteria)]